MAFSTKPPVLTFLLFFIVLLPIAQLTLAGRHLQATKPDKSKHTQVTANKRPNESKFDKKQAETHPGSKPNLDKKQPECFFGFEAPTVGVTVVSVPAGTGGQYLPGSGGSVPATDGQNLPGSGYGVPPATDGQGNGGGDGHGSVDGVPATTDGQGNGGGDRHGSVDGVPAATDGQGNGDGAPPTTGGQYMPGNGGSAPAARRPRYIPGNDDTFVPNPGFEVPNTPYGMGP